MSLSFCEQVPGNLIVSVRQHSSRNCELPQHPVSSHSCRIVLLTCDKVAVDNDMRRPRRFCNVTRSRNAEAIFQEPRCIAGEACLCLFLIAEAGERSILKGPRSIRTRRCEE